MIEKACKWFCDNSTPILITVIGGIIVYLVTTAIKKSRKIDFKGLIFYFDKFWQKLLGIKSSIFNRIREIIIGKENLKLLKELEKLKGNERAIKFLDNFSKEDNDNYKVNIKYEALNAFMDLYSNTARTNFCDYPRRFNEGDYLDLNGLRVEIFKELIKKYSK